MTHLLALFLAALGFAALGAAMARHQVDLVGRKLSGAASRLLRLGGALALALALAIDMAGLGAAYGAIAWFGHLTAGAAVVLARICVVSAARQRNRNG